MKRNNFGYLLREGIRGIFLHGLMSFAAICVTIACLIIMGSFSLILYNLNVMVKDLEKDNQILVYIDDTYSEAQAKSVGSQINMIANVGKAEYISRQQALDNFVAEQGDEELFGGVQADTFRDRYAVFLLDNDQMQQSVDEIKQIAGVADVSVRYEIYSGFQTVQRVLNIASVAIIMVLLVVSLFIISNTVKLAMYARREEIAIMRMVGATNGFIRWPFVVEGFFLGIFGAAIAFFLEWGLYNVLASKIASVDALQIISVVPFTSVLVVMAVAYAITGFIVGVFGSLLSIRKFLNV